MEKKTVIPEQAIAPAVVGQAANALEMRRLEALFDRLLDGSLTFTLNFQPIVDLRRGAAVGYEALVRFPEEIGLSPDACFKAAETSNKRLALEEMVARETLRNVKSLPPNCFLSVNISPALLLSAGWERILTQYPDLSRVIFEITEQDPVEDYLALRDRLGVVKFRGGHIAVDDAGAGYASLKHAMELRPNFLKLDRYFVGECHSSYVKSTLVEMIGKAASRMDAWIVAEGIEKLEELDELIRLSVPLGQGYFLGRPSPEMRPLPPEKSLEIIARTRALSQHTSIERVTETCAIIMRRSDLDSHAQPEGTHSFAMLIDPWKRPLELFECDGAHSWRRIAHPMRVQQTASVEETLHRSLMRPRSERFDALAVVDERGIFKGIVRIDKLIQGMLDEKAGLAYSLQVHAHEQQHGTGA